MDEQTSGAETLSTGEPEENEDVSTMDAADAAHEVTKAVTGRRGITRRYVLRLRRRNPEATPADLIALLERRYLVAISAAGAAVTAGSLVVEIGISLIPGGGAAAKGGKAAGKAAAKATAKSVGKGVLKNAAMAGGAHAAARLIPAGDKQLQFEITALYALALAEIHGLEFDQPQASALVHGLTNATASQASISAAALGLARAGGRKPPKNAPVGAWAATLSESLPGDAAQEFITSMASTEQLQALASGLTSKQQGAVGVGTGALAGGVQRFTFGKSVVEASHGAFPEAPATFPDTLTPAGEPEKAEDEPNPAIAAMEQAAQSLGQIAGKGAQAVASGVTGAGRTIGRATSSVSSKIGKPMSARPWRRRREAVDGDAEPCD